MYRMLAIFTYEMKWLMCGHCFCTYPPPWDALVSPRTEYLYEKRIGQVTSDLLYMRFIYNSIISRGAPGLATESAWGVWGRGWTIPSVWWSIFRLSFLLPVGMKVWYGGEGFFSWFLAFIHILYITQVLPNIFPPKLIPFQITLLYLVLCTDLFRRRSLSSF